MLNYFNDIRNAQYSQCWYPVTGQSKIFSTIIKHAVLIKFSKVLQKFLFQWKIFWFVNIAVYIVERFWIDRSSVVNSTYTSSFCQHFVYVALIVLGGSKTIIILCKYNKARAMLDKNSYINQKGYSHYHARLFKDIYTSQQRIHLTDNKRLKSRTESLMTNMFGKPNIGILIFIFCCFVT